MQEYNCTFALTNVNSPEPTNTILPFDPGLVSGAELKLLWHDDMFWVGYGMLLDHHMLLICMV